MCYSGRRYIQINVNKHENWQVWNQPINFELSELNHRDVQSLNRLAQLNFNIWAIVLQIKSEIVGEIFSPALKVPFL